MRRFTITNDDEIILASASFDGEWVRYWDVAKLQRDRDALLKALKWAMTHVGRYSHRIKGQNDAYCDAYDEAVAAIQQAEKED